MSENNMKSVLAFYRIEDESIFNKSMKDIWNDFVISKVEGVSCSNVFHFEFSTDVLLSLLKSSDITNELLSDINSEYDLGATVMFVMPVVGNPIDGFLLSNFLSN